MKLTEQGEVVSARYSTAEIAHRELELVAGAVLVSTVGALPAPSDEQLARIRVGDGCHGGLVVEGVSRSRLRRS